MSSGKTHDRVTWLCLPWIGALAYWGTKDWSLTMLLAGGFLVGGLMFGPDLDIYSVQFKRWGPLRWIWQPYQAVLEHRSWLSHAPLIGTTVRLIYFCSMLALISGVVTVCLRAMTHLSWDLGASWQWLYRWSTVHAQEVWLAIVGLELGALSHIIMDGLSSSGWKKHHKKRFRRKSRH